MPAFLPPLRLTGALCLRDGQLVQRSVALARGRFTTGAFPAVDLRGYYVLPGIVDLYATGHFGMGTSLAQMDRVAAAQGVTTRNVAVPWSWESPAFGPEAARGIISRMETQAAERLTDLRPVLTCETLMAPAQEALLDLVRTCGINQVVFTNRAAHLNELRSKDPTAFQTTARAQGHDSAALSAALDAVLPNASAVARHLCRMAEAFDGFGVLYGTEGDHTAEAREHHSMIGARLCVAPGTARVAAAARAVGDPVLACAMGATDQQVPGADALVQAGLCDALVSGGQGNVADTVFRLADLGVVPLARGWSLVSARPARIARLPDRGEIAPGKRADLAIVNIATRRVEATITAGRLSYLAGSAAERFRGLVQTGQMAAE